MTPTRSQRRDNARLEEELYGFLRQSNISERNLERIEFIARNPHSTIPSLAEVVLAIARVKPGKRQRLRVLAERHWDLFVRMAAVLDDAFWDDCFCGNGDEGEWLWERWEQARREARFEAYGKRWCRCGSEQPYWCCCAERDEEVAAQLEAEAQAREGALNPATIPWWHPDSGVDQTRRSAYEMFYADPDHPLAMPPPEWRGGETGSRPRNKRLQSKRARSVGRAHSGVK